MEPAFPGQPAEGRVVITAVPGKVFWDENGVLHATGKVLLKSTQYALEGDEATLDKAHEWATLSGHVRLQGKSIESTGRSVRANLKTGEWSLAEGTATILPEFFTGGQVADKLYLTAGSASSPREKGPIDLDNARLTSCNLEHPHYFFQCQRVEVRPGDRVIADHPSLYLLGYRVIRYPWKLVLFLDDKHNRYLPDVGHNDVEGYYMKFAFPYLVGALGQGLIHLNLTTMRGTGLGFEQQVVSARTQGLASVMWEPNESALTSRVSDHYIFSPSLTSDLDASYQSNSGYFGNTTSLDGNLLLSRHTSQGDQQLGYQNSISQSSSGSSSRWTSTFSDRERYGAQTSSSLRATWENFDYGGSGQSQQDVNTNFELTHTAGSLDMDLLASKLFEPSLIPGATRQYALNRLPELTVRTGTSRMKNYQLLGKIPFETSVVLGQYEQQPADIEAFRGAVDTTVGGNLQHWGKRTETTMSGRFMQSWFSDTSAQYIIGGDFDVRRDLGHDWQTRLHYTEGETHGFEPIALDFGSRASCVTLDTVQATTDRTRLEISSGYDFIGSFWQDLRVTGEWMPNAKSKLSLQTSYDLQDGLWRPLGLIWTQVALPRYYYTLAGEYDLGGTGLTRVSTELDWRPNRLWDLSMVSSWSGYTHTVDTLSMQLQRDLHCMIGSLSYDLAQHQIGFSLGIKAFPNPEQAFGVSRNGAQFQPLPGQYF